MSDKLPRLTSAQLIRVLEKQGWTLDRSRGSHHVYVHEQHQRILTIPVHNQKVVDQGIDHRGKFFVVASTQLHWSPVYAA